MQPYPIPQPAPLPSIARAANPRRDGAPSPRPVMALPAIDGITARATYRQATPGARDHDEAPHAPQLSVVVMADAARATHQDGAVAGRASIQFLAQHIAQERLSGARPAEGDSPLFAYRDVAERGTVFFGLEYPLDISI